MQKSIESAAKIFLEKIKTKPVKIISHHDTDGITSAAIISKMLKRLEKRFTVKIVKGLERSDISSLGNKEILIFLDLGSSLLDEISKLETDVFVIDHHEIVSKGNENIVMINPHMFDNELISAAGLSYLFSKAISSENKDLASLAVVGMVGDMMDKDISKSNNRIIQDAGVIIKRGLMLYPATRPVHKTLEYSSATYIPGVTGNSKGAIELLREVGIEKENGKYPSLIELKEEELSRLITAILLRTKQDDLIGNIFLVKFFNRLEDARELSAMINACSRLGHSHVALSFCMDSSASRQKADTIYADYKQHLISALNYAEQNKIVGKDYILLNAKNEIKDTIIGTVASIISMSKEHREGTTIIAMSYDKDKMKVSARIAGRSGRNARELLETAMTNIGGECGGHPLAAGCLISREKEAEFIKNLTNTLNLELVKI